MKYLVVALLACLGLAVAQTPFEADVAIYNDPNIKGTMIGILDYDASSQMSIRYPSIAVQEVYLFSQKLKYIICSGACDAQTWQDPMPKFYKESGDSPISGITLNGRSCSGFQKSSGTVLNIYVDSAGPCRAVERDGTTYDFSNIRGVDNSQFGAYQGKGCPVQQCGKKIDFVFVLDESGSITPSSFSYMKDFAKNVATSYTYGAQGAAVGIVMFASSARVVINLNQDETSVTNAINSIQQLGGNTCIGCGIQTGYNMYVNYGRSQAQKVMLFMTDGQNNRQTSTFPQVLATAKNYGITIFAIGVGNDVDHTEIHAISSSVPGIQTEFYSPSYADLNNIVNQLVIVTCVDIPGNPCGAGCLGYCSCGKTCICPSSCDDGNPCTDDNCNAASNGAGCTYSSHTCNDGNACTVDSCNPAIPGGCTTSPLDCSTPDKCLTPSCDASVGCQYKSVSCDDNDVCTSDTCDSNAGCQHATIPCDKCKNPVPVVCTHKPCFTSSCAPSNGTCQDVPYNCDDGNPCSVDTCDTTKDACAYSPTNCDDGNACTVDFCSPTANATAGIVAGCNNKYVNVTSFCDDVNACTIDTCNNSTGCVNTPIVCNDNLTCTTDLCNSLLGCQFVVRDCTNDPSIPKLSGNCYVATCAEGRGCYVKPFPGRKIDKCGVCDGDGKSCVALNTAQAAGIAAGVLAAIIIGAIAVCAILGAIGGKKGYDIYMRNRNNMTGANTNPLYTDNGLSGTNPMYTDAHL